MTRGRQAEETRENFALRNKKSNRHDKNRANKKWEEDLQLRIFLTSVLQFKLHLFGSQIFFSNRDPIQYSSDVDPDLRVKSCLKVQKM